MKTVVSLFLSIHYVAKDRPKWRAAVYGSKSAVEERCLAQYQRTHERRHSQPAMTSFQCINCMKLCRSNAGLAAHRRACSVPNTTVTHAPEPLSIFCCPHCHLIFATQHSLYTHLRTYHKNCFLVIEFDFGWSLTQSSSISLECLSSCQYSVLSNNSNLSYITLSQDFKNLMIVLLHMSYFLVTPIFSKRNLNLASRSTLEI